jgi:antitoxin ParD1/3/4
MATMNISLPESLKTFVDEQVAGRGYSTSSEYVRELIRKEQDREKLRNLLLEGAASPPAGPADDAWFEELRQHAVKHAKK